MYNWPQCTGSVVTPQRACAERDPSDGLRVSLSVLFVTIDQNRPSVEPAALCTWGMRRSERGLNAFLTYQLFSFSQFSLANISGYIHEKYEKYSHAETFTNIIRMLPRRLALSLCIRLRKYGVTTWLRVTQKHNRDAEECNAAFAELVDTPKCHHAISVRREYNVQA